MGKVIVLKESLETVSSKYHLHKQAMKERIFINELGEVFREWMGWVTTTISAITCNDLAKTYNDGVYLVEKHNAIHQRIEDRDLSFQDILSRLNHALVTCPKSYDHISSFISNLKHRRTVSWVLNFKPGFVQWAGRKMRGFTAVSECYKISNRW